MAAVPTDGASAVWRWAALTAALVAAVLIPFALFADDMDALAAQTVAHGTGWAGAAVLAGLLAGDVLLPVPSSVLSTACGLLFGAAGGTAVSAAGLTAGCLIGYALGRGLGGEHLARLVTPQGAERVAALVARHGAWALVLLRGVPVLAEVSVVVAGMVRMPFGPFALAVSLSNLGLSAAYAVAGAWAWDGGAAALLPFAAAVGLPAAARLLGARLTAAPSAGMP